MPIAAPEELRLHREAEVFACLCGEALNKGVWRVHRRSEGMLSAHP